MNLLLDTSVLVAAFTPDLHTRAAEAVLSRARPIIVSDWAAAEFSAAIRIKVRQGVVEAAKLDVVETSFEQWVDRLDAARALVSSDHTTARGLVRRHSFLRAPDALHIAIAQRLGATLATLDERQAKTARLEGLDVAIP